MATAGLQTREQKRADISPKEMKCFISPLSTGNWKHLIWLDWLCNKRTFQMDSCMIIFLTSSLKPYTKQLDSVAQCCQVLLWTFWHPVSQLQLLVPEDMLLLSYSLVLRFCIWCFCVFLFRQFTFSGSYIVFHCSLFHAFYNIIKGLYSANSLCSGLQHEFTLTCMEDWK